jgi:hypothetical protein
MLWVQADNFSFKREKVKAVFTSQRSCYKTHRKFSIVEKIFLVLRQILFYIFPVLRIRIRIWFWIHRIHMFLGLLAPDPDPLVRGMDPDPDPSIIKQK